MGLLNRIIGTRVYLDTNLFIYALEGFPEFADTIRELFAAIENGALSAITSELTLAETLVKPFMDNDSQRQQAYLDAIQTSDVLTVLPVSREILIEAARLRSSSSLRLPDAIHLATALSAGCTSFLTNDRKIAALPGISIVTLDEP